MRESSYEPELKQFFFIFAERGAVGSCDGTGPGANECWTSQHSFAPSFRCIPHLQVPWTLKMCWNWQYFHAFDLNKVVVFGYRFFAKINYFLVDSFSDFCCRICLCHTGTFWAMFYPLPPSISFGVSKNVVQKAHNPLTSGSYLDSLFF